MVESSRCQSRKDHGAGGSGIISGSSTITAVDWKVVLGTAALSGVASLLTSLAGLPELKESEVK